MDELLFFLWGILVGLIFFWWVALDFKKKPELVSNAVEMYLNEPSRFKVDTVRINSDSTYYRVALKK